jgi:hypothetical protein
VKPSRLVEETRAGVFEALDSGCHCFEGALRRREDSVVTWIREDFVDAYVRDEFVSAGDSGRQWRVRF